jgi:hypothetical protein
LRTIVLPLAVVALRFARLAAAACSVLARVEVGQELVTQPVEQLLGGLEVFRGWTVLDVGVMKGDEAPVSVCIRYVRYIRYVSV